MNYAQCMQFLNDWFLGWPLIIYVLAVGVFCTVACGFIQIRYFISSWKSLFASMRGGNTKGDVTPLQAFINTLSANLGNGSIAGMATAIHLGGPGAAFWMVVVGLIMMAVRFAEVYLSIYFGQQHASHSGLGGPMLYLRSVVGGPVLAWLYGTSCLFFGLAVGNGIQSNTIGASLQNTWGVPLIVTAVIMCAFMWYIVTGGSQRVSKASEAIVPLKVIVFFGSSLIVLGYHYTAIIPAFNLIMASAFKPVALMGGVLGFAIQQAMRFGISRAIMANESGLGTAAILFSSTGSKHPVNDALMSMLSTFISVIVCLIISLCIIVSGVDAWSNPDMTGAVLTSAAYQTVFGSFGGWIVSFLSVSFGIGVAVAFAYICREAWLYTTNGRGSMMLFNVIYSGVAFITTLMSVCFVWELAEIMNAVMLAINLFGLVCLLPVVRAGLNKWQADNK